MNAIHIWRVKHKKQGGIKRVNGVLLIMNYSISFTWRPGDTYCGSVFQISATLEIFTTLWQLDKQNAKDLPDSKVHGANMGPTWVLSAPGGSHVSPMNLAIWAIIAIAYQ